MSKHIQVDPGRKIEVPLKEALRVNLLLEELVHFLHQPENYETQDQMLAWLHGGPYEGGVFQELRDTFYHTVSTWLPPDVAQQLDSR